MPNPLFVYLCPPRLQPHPGFRFCFNIAVFFDRVSTPRLLTDVFGDPMCGFDKCASC